MDGTTVRELAPEATADLKFEGRWTRKRAHRAAQTR